MPYRARIVVDALDPNVVDQIDDLLRIDFGDRSVERDSSGLVYCFANSPEHAHHLRRLIIELLERCELADAVGQVRIEHWDKRKKSWVTDHSRGSTPVAHLVYRIGLRKPQRAFKP